MSFEDSLVCPHQPSYYLLILAVEINKCLQIYSYVNMIQVQTGNVRYVLVTRIQRNITAVNFDNIKGERLYHVPNGKESFLIEKFNRSLSLYKND